MNTYSKLYFDAALTSKTLLTLTPQFTTLLSLSFSVSRR